MRKNLTWSHCFLLNPRLHGSISPNLSLSLSLCVPLPQLNASDDRGIEVVRDQIKSFASTKNVFTWVFHWQTRSFGVGFSLLSLSFSLNFSSSPPSLFSLLSNQAGGFKLIVLDEADAMTTAAQGALRRGEFSLATYQTFVFVTDVSQSTLPLFSSLTVLSTPSSFFFSRSSSSRSHRTIHKERQVLHHLQLRQQDYTCYPISLHQVQIQSVGTGSGGE